MGDKPPSPATSQNPCCKKAVSEIGQSNCCLYATARLWLSTTQPKGSTQTGQSTGSGQQPARPQKVPSPPRGTPTPQDYVPWDGEVQTGKV